MTKNMLRLIVVLLLATTPLQAPPLMAAAQDDTQEQSSQVVDRQVWQQIAAAPGHQVTLIVRMLEQPGLSLDATIDAQLRLEQALALLQTAGSVSSYQAYYGENILAVTGGIGALRFLQAWPEVAGISPYTPGQDWELRLQESTNLEAPNATGQITGRVTQMDGVTPISGILITAYMQTGPVSWAVVGTATTNASGDYTVGSLATGIYRVKFSDPLGNYPTEYYNNQLTFYLATNFTVTDGQVMPNINAQMAQAGKISGKITKAAGGNASEVVASAWLYSGGTWLIVSSAVSDNQGNYLIGSLMPGTYKVKFSDVYSPPRYLDQWYNGVLTLNLASDVVVVANTITPNINAAMGDYGSIRGNVKASDGTTNLVDITVDIYRFNPDPLVNDWEWYSFGDTDSSGNYQASGLDTNTYRVEFSDPYNQFAGEFYNDKADITTADNVAVALGFTTSNINAQLALATDTISNSLVTGWNLVSLPVTTGNPAPSAAFASILGSHGDIYAWNCSDTIDPWKLYNPALPPPVNDLITTSVTQGYWVNMTAPGTLTLTGTHPLSTAITLCPGWNLIGYPSVSITPVATALSSISGKYNLVWQYKASDAADPWKSYNPALPPNLNDLINMEPGYGYWIRMTQAATLTLAGR